MEHAPHVAIERFYMHAKRRKLKLGQFEVRTPLLLPSFSSKGFPRVAETLKAMEEYISDEILVSAYDLHHRHVKQSLDFASLVFLDSGGYEAAKEYELSETFERAHCPDQSWSSKDHNCIIQNWSCKSPTVFVSFDIPTNRAKTAAQIADAKKLPIPIGNNGCALLLKPESKDAKRLHLENVLPLIPDMRDFSVIGVTEKEIGKSLFDRMKNISLIRSELSKRGLETPIHVFGSLDTMSSYLYFISGADIFDGLTWLRYAFFDGDTIYRHAYGFQNLPITTNSDIVEARCWSNNLQYMQDMKLAMIRFEADRNFAHFGKHGAKIDDASQIVTAELKGE